MTILTCNCNADAACPMHAEELYPRPDTTDHDARDDHRQFLDATADFYIPGWTPADEDSREHDCNILSDMREEAESNPEVALALRELYGSDYLARYVKGGN